MSYLALAKKAISQLGTAGELAFPSGDDEIGAALIKSARFGEIWVVIDSELITEIIDEEARKRTHRPVLHTADVIQLAGKPDAAIRAALKVAAVFPGVKVLQ
jgi:hypothetical protein